MGDAYINLERNLSAGGETGSRTVWGGDGEIQEGIPWGSIEAEIFPEQEREMIVNDSLQLTSVDTMTLECVLFCYYSTYERNRMVMPLAVDYSDSISILLRKWGNGINAANIMCNSPWDPSIYRTTNKHNKKITPPINSHSHKAYTEKTNARLSTPSTNFKARRSAIMPEQSDSTPCPKDQKHKSGKHRHW
jgi:hypothetical protein